MIFLMITTDTTSLHSWSSIIIQDVILPLRKKMMSMSQHLKLLRITIVFVAAYAFVFSCKFGQVTYILMFMALTGAIWLGGAGVVIIGGLYWKRATAAGAWSAVIASAVLAGGGFMCTQTWANTLYPFLEARPGLLASVTHIIEGASGPLEPIIQWRVTPDQFPMNGQEIYFMTMVISTLLFIGVSLLTCKEHFNMDRMLHRGEYCRSEDKAARPRKTGNLLSRIIGIDNQFTKADRVLSWSVFIYGIVWGFGIWLIKLIWNLVFYRWPLKWWAWVSFVDLFIISVIIGAVSTVWFSIGTFMDLRKLFQRLAVRERNSSDDGRVIGHINADEVDLLAAPALHGVPGTDEADGSKRQ
jgi:SSS family solute:Na+ symporter